jgi:hypothetical protein
MSPPLRACRPRLTASQGHQDQDQDQDQRQQPAQANLECSIKLSLSRFSQNASDTSFNPNVKRPWNIDIPNG